MRAWQIFTPDDVAPMLASLTRNASKKRSGKRGDKRPELVSVRGYERRWPHTSLEWLP